MRLELPAPVLRPPLNDYLGLRVELDCVMRLSMQVPEEAFTPSAKWETRHGSCHTDIDADVSGVHFISEAAGICAIGGEDARHISVAAVVDQRNRFFDRARMHQAEHRAKNLSSRGLSIWRDIVQHGGKYEVAILVTAHFAIAAIHKNTCSVRLAFADETFNARF